MSVSRAKKPLARRRESANERKIAYEVRTVEEQLALINSRPGESKKERTRLEKQISE
jgi:hypothetical protein